MTDLQVWYPHYRDLLVGPEGSDTLAWRCAGSNTEKFHPINNRLFFTAFQFGMKTMLDALVNNEEFNKKFSGEEFYNLCKKLDIPL